MIDLPEAMPAAVYRQPGEVVVEERPVPRPGPGEVLVEVDHCGICGTDIHLLLDGWGRPGIVAGHEFTGHVADLGPGAAGWEIGQPVVGGTSPRCGRCRRCIEGKPSQCENQGSITGGGHDGAFAGYVVTRAESLLALPAGLTTRQAALAEPMAVALHGITRSGVSPGDRVMVIGAGPIGALSIAALVARGIGPVIVVEPGERRRRLARDLGAAEVIGPDDLERFPSWEPERLAERAVHVVLECSGRKEAIESGFHQLLRGGTLALVGAGIEPLTFDPNRFVLNELHVVGSFLYDQDGFARGLELLGSDGFPIDRLIEADDVPLDRLSDALTGLAEGRFAGKVMVVPRLSGDDTSVAGDNDRDENDDRDKNTKNAAKEAR
jgi:2-desacetyl-2-hydroxyethyl bacteriochlorophyllide A dehydrogenase